MTEETKKKMSLAKLGKKRPDLVGKKFCLGLKQSKESNQKRSQFMTEHPNKPWLGKTFSEEHKRKQRDSILKGILEGRNKSWKGGITPENRRIRNSSELKLWRKACMERDNFTCQKTGEKGGKLVVHHIHNFAFYPELRTSIENGITLSKKAHKEFHHKYGKRNNTKEQLQEFLTVV